MGAAGAGGRPPGRRPDLPAHSRSGGGDGRLDRERVLDWLEALVRRTSSAPVLVGHVLGGSLAARYAAARGEALRGLVLVDSLGLARFRPSLHDRALPLQIADAASEGYGWSLHVVEEAADDPCRDRSRAFLRELRSVFADFERSGAATGSPPGLPSPRHSSSREVRVLDGW